MTNNSRAASTERLLEIIPYRSEERGGNCLHVALPLLLPVVLPLQQERQYSKQEKRMYNKQ
jgi:hypothetical protein